MHKVRRSADIATTWRSYLDGLNYKYKFDEKSGELTFVLPCAAISEDVEITVKINRNYYCIYARFPFVFDDTMDTVSELIHRENQHTLLVNLTFDYDTKSAYCVISNFCGDGEIDAEEIKSDITRICSHIESYYNKFFLVAKAADNKHDKKSLPNSAGLDYFCKNYLDKKGISYSLYSDNEKYNHLVDFTEDELRFDMLIEDEAIVADAVGSAIPFVNNQKLLQVKEYIQRCNHENGQVRFVFYGVIGSNLNIACRFESFFTENTMESALLGGTEELKQIMKTFYPGLIKVGLGELTAKEAFQKYCTKDDVNE